MSSFGSSSMTYLLTMSLLKKGLQIAFIIGYVSLTKFVWSLFQVVLKWNMQRGVCVIPKSVTPSRIRSNLQVGYHDGYKVITIEMRGLEMCWLERYWHNGIKRPIVVARGKDLE